MYYELFIVVVVIIDHLVYIFVLWLTEYINSQWEINKLECVLFSVCLVYYVHTSWKHTIEHCLSSSSHFHRESPPKLSNYSASHNHHTMTSSSQYHREQGMLEDRGQLYPQNNLLTCNSELVCCDCGSLESKKKPLTTSASATSTFHQNICHQNTLHHHFQNMATKAHHSKQKANSYEQQSSTRQLLPVLVCLLTFATVLSVLIIFSE